jgi:hypothetical protein
LTDANNKAKVRRSIKLMVLEKAKVISYKDIEEARAKRAIKDAIKSNRKRSRKRKNIELKANEAELELEVKAEVKVVSNTKKVKNGKGTRICKRRSIAVEACEPEAELETQLEL